MTNRKNFGFTLVELLVVITILAVLMGLLMVGLNAARGPANESVCINNQRNIAAALLSYENSKGTLPGYLNKSERSWVVEILQQLGEPERHRKIFEGDTSAYAKIDHLVCPVNEDTIAEAGLLAVSPAPPLSYVVNTGYYDGTTMKYGIFNDRSGTGANAKKSELSRIKDGASNTILITENSNAGSWNIKGFPAATKNLEGPIGYSGFRWDDPSLGYNELGRNSTLPEGFTPDEEELFSFARPASKHTGGVIVSYADGSSKKMNDDIDEQVYFKACCPEDATAEKFFAENAGGGDEEDNP